MSHINIECKNLSFGYQKDETLKNINFRINEGESVGIIGENGAGKSTLLKLMTGLHMNFKGEIRVEDVLLQKSTLPFIRERLGYIFQDSDNQLFMSTVYDDVAFAPLNYGLSKEEAEKRVDHALSEVNGMHLKQRRTHQLSGGEKKMAAVATILSMLPDILLLDEPSAALDPRNRRNLIRIVNGFSHMKLIASHDLDFIMDTCSRVILISNGQIVKDADTISILTDQKLLEEHGLELPLSLSRR